MNKTAIVTDSNSGITQLQGKELGIHIIPMPFNIGEETFYEDISLTQEGFYEHLKGRLDISTSQPSPESVTKLWDSLLKDYEQVVHIPMSSGLSGSCQTAHMLSQEYGGRVEVVNNQRVSVTQRQSVLEAKAMADGGKNAAEIKEILEKTKLDSSIYITVDTLAYLKKGGRITPAVAALGTLLKIKPVLQIQGEKLDTYAKARTVKQAKAIMFKAIKADIDQRFGGYTEGAAPEDQKVYLQMAYTYDREAALQMKAELLEEFPGYSVHMDPLALSIACHIGPGALAVACTKKLVWS